MPKLIFLLFRLQKGSNRPKMMGSKFSDPSFISWGVLNREPVGVNLAGKETNFNVHRYKDRIAPHNKNDRLVCPGGTSRIDEIANYSRQNWRRNSRRRQFRRV